MIITRQLFNHASALFWFGAVVGFLMLMGEVADEVRHGHENLMIGFVIPLWGFAVLFSTLVSRSLWITFPALSPRKDAAQRDVWCVVGAVCLSLALGAIWGKSVLFSYFYDSCKIILTLQIAGLLLGMIYRIGGSLNVLSSLLIALVAALAACLGLLAIVYLMTRDGAPNAVEVARSLTSVGVPLAISMALYDCLLQSQFTSDGTISLSASARS